MATSLVAVVALVAAFGTRGARPEARISVRWADDVDPVTQRQLERQLDLRNPLHRQATSWSYSIVDTSEASLRAIVIHEAVADTHGIDRATYRLTEPPTRDWSGVARMWLALTIYSVSILGGVGVLAGGAIRLGWNAWRGAP